MAKKKTNMADEIDKLEEQDATGTDGVAKKVEAPRFEKEDVLIRHEFSDTELAAIGEQVAERADELNRLEDNKKSAAAEFDSEMKKIKIVINDYLRNLREKSEMRQMECWRVFHYPRKKVYYFRCDETELDFLKSFQTVVELIDFAENNPEELRYRKVREMKNFELQKPLPFDEPKDVADIENDEEKTRQVKAV